jgi:hypothetical protein
MPGLDRSIVEHRLPIKPGFRPYKQPPRIWKVLFGWFGARLEMHTS